MDQDKNSRAKIVTVGLLFGCQLFSYMIRLTLAIAAPTLMKEYHYSRETMGYLLAGWNWSYTGALAIIGLVVDRFGPWIVMGLGSVIWSLSTIALPVSAAVASIFAMRLLFGLGHSPLIPANAAAISRLFKAKERTRAVSVSFAGNQVGLAIGASVATYIMIHSGSQAHPNWKAAFYWIGGASLLLTIAWFLFYPDKRIGRQSTGAQGAGQARVSWASLFQYRSTWGIALGQFGYLYAYFFFVSWAPSYLSLERKMSTTATGTATAILFWAGLVGTLGGGWLGDYIAGRKTLTFSRKSIIAIGLIGAMITMFAAAFVKETWLAVTLLATAVGSLRLATGSVNSLPVDMAPLSAVGSLTSIQNFFGNVGGLLAPIVTGKVVQMTGSFVGALLVAGGMALFGALAYLFIMGDLEKNRIEPKASVIPPNTVPFRAV